MNDNSVKVMEVDVNDILPNRFQPRIKFDEEQILELSDSIKEHGVIQPIVVRAIGNKYEIIAGERRYKASILAGKEKVPVVIKNLNDRDSAEIALIENVQRKNLTPIEEALSYKKILDMGYITQDNLAKKLGKSQSAVANKIRLLNLSDEVQEALLDNKISERHARSLLRLPTFKLQNEMLNRIIEERLTVRRTDEEIDKMKNLNESLDKIENNENEKEEKLNMENNMPNTNQFFDTLTPSNGGMNNNQSTTPIDVTPIPEQVQPQPQFFNIFEPNINNANVQSGISQPQQVDLPNVTTTPVVETPAMATPEMPATQSFGAVPEQTTQTFDFGVPQFSVPTVEQPSVVDMPVASQNVEPTNMTVPEIQPINEMPTANIEPQTIPSFGEMPITDMPTTTPAVETPTMATQSFEVVPEQPTQTFDFGAPQFSVPTVEQPPVMEMPVSSQSVEPTNMTVPETQPIIEQPEVQQPDNSFNSSMPQQPESTEQPVQIPEPIIITDYSKQYDPVMPEQSQPETPKISFREVINLIRECSDKIESYGFKIDVEEYDLTNMYQVIFKIEK